MEKIDVEKMLQALANRQGTAAHIAESIGVQLTTKGPIAQARRDGYSVAIRDAIQALNDL